MVDDGAFVGHLAVDDFLDLGADGAHCLDETIQLAQVLGLGGLHHEGAGHRESQGRGVEAKVYEALGDVRGGDPRGVGKRAQIQDAFMGHQASIAGVEHREGIFQGLGQVICAQNCVGGGLSKSLRAAHS